MASINTKKYLDKLERITEFRTGSEQGKYPIIIQGTCPATDGTNIFIPDKIKIYKSVEDNLLFLADTQAHESDHIREFNEYFEAEADSLRESGRTNLVAEYIERNYIDLTENQALAAWIDNVVEDRRIDVQRRTKLPGSLKVYNNIIQPTAKYLRPSIRVMNELDAFREQYLQLALIGKTVEPVSEKHARLLEEIISLTNNSDSIFKDKGCVSTIYQKFKENFDITQPISRLPPVHGTGSEGSGSGGSGESSGSSGQENSGSYNQGDKGKKQEDKNKEGKDGMDGKEDKNKEGKDGKDEKSETKKTGGYGREIKPREGRDPNDKKPDAMDDNGKSKISNNYEGKPANESYNKSKPENDNDFYKTESDMHGMKVFKLESKANEWLSKYRENLRKEHNGDIERMKRVFKLLKLRDYGEKRDVEGLDLDYEQYLQGELEAKVTKIKGDEKNFYARNRNRLKPVLAIHSDASGSTSGEIIEAIKSCFYVIGNALSVSQCNYSMYVSGTSLGVIKSPTEKWNNNMNNVISGIQSGLTVGEGGIYLAATSSIIADDLKRVEGNPKGIIIISDFDVCGKKGLEKKAVKDLYDSKIYPLLIAIGNEHAENAKYLTSDIGEDFYSVVGLDQLNMLPEKLFRSFKKYGIAR